MKRALLLIVAALPVLAVDGTVINQTTGKPAGATMVTLYKLGEGGMQPIQTVKTDAEGRFAVNESAPAQGPRLLQVIFDGVVYNQMLTPGSPTTGLNVRVYNASKQPGDAKIAQHMVLLEPGNNQLNVSEAYIFANSGKTTYNDPANGTLRFWLPEAAKGIVKVSVTPPAGMPLERPAERTAQANTYKVDFPIRPGETRIDLQYLTPFQEDGTFAGKVLYKGQGPTRIVTPASVTASGDGIQPLGAEPQTKANIYEVKAAAFQVTLQGSGSLAQQQQQDQADAQDGPQVEQVMPKVWENVIPIVALAFGILALGFILLYRAQPRAAEGKHEQRRRG